MLLSDPFQLRRASLEAVALRYLPETAARRVAGEVAAFVAILGEEYLDILQEDLQDGLRSGSISPAAAVLFEGLVRGWRCALRAAS